MRSVRISAINLFLIFHLIAITCWCIPLNSALVTAIRGAVRPYMLWSGLFQAWDMFAPTPRAVNAHIEAAVIFKDGRIHTWKFPRMEQLSLTERAYKERYRKFVENVQEQTYAGLWPDVARYIARANDSHSNDPPQVVMLIRYWSDIPSPEQAAPHPPPERARIFFEYNVKPEDLK